MNAIMNVIFETVKKKVKYLFHWISKYKVKWLQASFAICLSVPTKHQEN